jgi:transposase-like protein
LIVRGSARNSDSRRGNQSEGPTPRLSNIVKTAVRIIAESDNQQVPRAAKVIGVSEPTLYRWRRAGNMRQARGAEVLRVHELTGLPMEMLLRG